MTSDMELKRIYNKFNAEYFGGELPDDLPIWWEPCMGAAAETVVLESTPGESPTLGIRIDPAMKLLRRHGKLDILHEMIHVKQWPKGRWRDHGNKFDEEMQRLCSFRSYRKLL